MLASGANVGGVLMEFVSIKLAEDHAVEVVDVVLVRCSRPIKVIGVNV